MTKGKKIALWIVGVLVALIAAAVICVDTIASKAARAELDDLFADTPEVQASFGRIHVFLLSGSVLVNDIRFEAPNLSAEINNLNIAFVDYFALLKNRRLSIAQISIDKPTIALTIDEKAENLGLPQIKIDAPDDSIKLNGISLGQLELNKACLRLKSSRTKLDVAVDSLTAECNDLWFDPETKAFGYNDSVYLFELGSLHLTTPDGEIGVETHGVKTKNQGGLAIGYTRVQNLISVLKLADKKNEPTTWIDMELNAVKTSDFNPIRKALAKDYTLQSIDVDLKRMAVKRDMRHAPKEPFPTPQEFLMRLPVTFDIQTVNAKVQEIDVELYLQRENPGKVQIKKAHAELSNITNRKGAAWVNKAHAPVGDGTFDAEYTIHMDEKSTFDISLRGTNIEGSFLSPLMRPIVGLTFDCDISLLEAQYSGDSKMAAGEFEMQYRGLHINAFPEEKVAIAEITKYADLISDVANSLLTKSNPSSVDVRPRRYKVDWKRDEWKEYPLYLFGCCINGAVETLTPGLNVHRQILK